MNNYLKTDECWYKDTCNHYDTEKCNNCIRFLEMSYLMTSSNIPKSNQFKNELIPTRIDLDNFKFLNNIKTNESFFNETYDFIANKIDKVTEYIENYMIYYHSYDYYD